MVTPPKITYTVEQDIDTQTLLGKVITDLNNTQYKVIERNAFQLGEVVGDFIFEKVLELHPIGKFMAARQQTYVEVSSRMIMVHILGIPETDVRDEYTDRRNKPVSAPYNLWAMFEFGRQGGKYEGGVKFSKMTSGGSGSFVVGKHAAITTLAGSVGVVRSIIDQITPQLVELLTATIVELLSAYGGKALEKASGGKIKYVPRPIKVEGSGSLALTGTTTQQLANLGYTTYISPNGQVSLRNNKGQFAKQTKTTKEILSTDPNIIVFRVAE